MSGATPSRERFLLECAEQERRDLERAHKFMQEHFDCQDVICTFAAGCGCAAEIAHLVAAARREGAEEMRERAARCARYWTASQKVADHIRALPLTPEEP